MKEVAAAIAYRSGRVLVTRRAEGEQLAGFWEFPGGKLETGETPADCIVRELREELGVLCRAGEMITRSVHQYPGGAITLIAIAVELADDDFHLSVHDAAKFVLPADLLSMNLAPADIPIAKYLIEHGPHSTGLRKTA